MLNFHLNKTRSGEWGDHVTLQAAADLVWFLFFIFPFLELCQVLFYLLLIGMLKDGKFSIVILYCTKAYTDIHVCMFVYVLSPEHILIMFM
jgi:hypothetical protein